MKYYILVILLLTSNFAFSKVERHICLIRHSGKDIILKIHTIFNANGRANHISRMLFKDGNIRISEINNIETKTYTSSMPWQIFEFRLPENFSILGIGPLEHFSIDFYDSLFKYNMLTKLKAYCYNIDTYQRDELPAVLESELGLDEDYF